MAAQQPERAITEIFGAEIGAGFSKYMLAKAYLRWTQGHSATDLTENERAQWSSLVEGANQALR